MRFKDEQVGALIFWPMIVITSPVWGIIVGAVLIEEHARKWKRAMFGPRVGEWQEWFAWFPVRLDGGWGDLVWLETVSRTSVGSSYNHMIVYELPSPITSME